MRTKTLALSALLGMLGSASVMAQNVYSVNAVGYINVTIPPGFSILTCPLVSSPDNTLNTLLPNLQVAGGNSPSTYAGLTVFQLNGHGGFNVDVASSYSAGWVNGGTLAINPGTAVFLDNVFYPLSSGASGTFSATLVGSVPSSASGLFTNVLTPGFNLVGSIIPVTGDLQTSSILNLPNNLVNGGALPSTLENDTVYFYNATYNGHAQIGFEAAQAYSYSAGWSGGTGPGGDPSIPAVSQGFYFDNVSSQNVNWVENFTLNP
jgi:hypothetical protein